MRPSEWIGHFSLWGDFNAEEITVKLGLTPSVVYPKGETTLSDSPALVTTWDMHCPQDLEASEQLDYLIEVLEPHAANLRELASRFQGCVNLVGDGVFCLKPTMMLKLGEMNLTLNYFVDNEPSHENQDSTADAAVSA